MAENCISVVRNITVTTPVKKQHKHFYSLIKTNGTKRGDGMAPNGLCIVQGELRYVVEKVSAAFIFFSVNGVWLFLLQNY